MRRNLALGLATILALSSPVYAKSKASPKLHQDSFEGFIHGDTPALVMFYSHWDKGQTEYGALFEKFCVDNKARVRCGVVDIETDSALGQAHNALIGTPHTLLYDAQGKEMKRTKGIQTREQLDAAFVTSYSTPAN